MGERFLAVDMSVLNEGGSRCGGGSTNFGNTDVRPVIDGVPEAPLLPVNTIIRPDTAQDLTYHFAIPADAENLALEVGSSDGVLFSSDVVLPPLPELQAESGPSS